MRILGYGKRLFGDGTVPSALERIDTRSTSTGVAVDTYRAAGIPRHGAFAVAPDGSQASDVDPSGPDGRT